jgi:hypothetical protein
MICLCSQYSKKVFLCSKLPRLHPLVLVRMSAQWYCRKKPKRLRNDLSRCLFIHKKCHIGWPGFEPGLPLCVMNLIKIAYLCIFISYVTANTSGVTKPGLLTVYKEIIAVSCENYKVRTHSACAKCGFFFPIKTGDKYRNRRDLNFQQQNIYIRVKYSSVSRSVSFSERV